MFEFSRQYGTEAQCEQALFSVRWPDGFVCPACGHTGYCEIKPRKLYQCHRCHQQTSLTSGTIFAHTTLDLRIWFLAMYLITQSKAGISALALRRELGIGYNAEFCYRFNRRFQLEDLIPRLTHAAVRTPPMPDRLLRLAEGQG